MKLIESFDEGISLVELPNGDRKYICHGVLGEDASREFDERENKEQPFNASFNGGQEMFRMFDTKEAAEAYWQGINDLDGYFGFLATSYENHFNAFQQK